MKHQLDLLCHGLCHPRQSDFCASHHIWKRLLNGPKPRFWQQSEKGNKIFLESKSFCYLQHFVITVVPAANPGFPHPASCPLISLESKLLVLAISSRYLFQSENESLGEFLEKETITMFENSLRRSHYSSKNYSINLQNWILTRFYISKHMFASPLFVCTSVWDLCTAKPVNLGGSNFTCSLNSLVRRL
mgnify:CR=1 FL=1